MRLTVLLAGALLCVLLQPADARPRHPPSLTGRVDIGCADPIMHPCYPGGAALSRRDRVALKRQERRAKLARKRHQSRVSLALERRASDPIMPPGLRRVMAEGAGRVVPHPDGCPRRAFCGCGAAVRIFGKPIRSLWLVAEWLRRFPRAQAARGMAAVRRDGHHIVVLEEHISGALWRVYDANSGRHRTRVHLRSIAGWTIVDPRGA